MTIKQEMISSVKTTPCKLFTGTLTLDDTKAKGVQYIIITLIDEQGKQHTLRTCPTKTECIPGGEVQRAYSLASSEAMIVSGSPMFEDRDIESGEYVDEQGCVWYLNSEQNTAGDLIEKYRECIGSEPPEPMCARIGEVIIVK